MNHITNDKLSFLHLFMSMSRPIKIEALLGDLPQLFRGPSRWPGSAPSWLLIAAHDELTYHDDTLGQSLFCEYPAEINSAAGMQQP